MEGMGKKGEREINKIIKETSEMGFDKKSKTEKREYKAKHGLYWIIEEK